MPLPDTRPEGPKPPSSDNGGHRRLEVHPLLAGASETVVGRRASYGDPAEFFEAVAKRWTLTLGVPISAQQAVLCLLDLKQERLRRDPAHTDSINDVAGYAACLWEINR